VRIVTAPTAQFDTVYDQSTRTYLSAGYQAILDEKQRVIAAGNYIQ
jgi:hypothetical protein